MARVKNKVILTCTVCLNRNYTTTINKLTHRERLEVKKYCKHCDQHTLHRETK
ncbi:MAG: 50S ribosomal protein L33 [Erysipelothrix sp.]|nr:50S ribosomal protein L33 [Erysipelothrix sp.]